VQIKTTVTDGLILYYGGWAGGGGGDSSTVDDGVFFVLEMVGGQLRYVYNPGGGRSNNNNIRAIKVNIRSAVGDNRWHSVGIQRVSLSESVLSVDDSVRTDTAGHSPSSSSSVHGSGSEGGTDELFVGGVPPELYNRLLRLVSRTGQTFIYYVYL